MSFDGAKLLLPRNNNSANLYVEKHIYGGVIQLIEFQCIMATK